MRVPAGGGGPQVLTAPDRGKGEVAHQWPQFLPGAKAVVLASPATRMATRTIAATGRSHRRRPGPRIPDLDVAPQNATARATKLAQEDFRQRGW
jgi:hypothetical protein